MNGYKPFTYDFEDFSGSEDLSQTFVTKVMRTHSGQCRSLPMYYKVLAEAIGAEAHITFAPQHLFIRHRDEQSPSKWVNVELTTQSLAREIFYIENFGISADAIRNKVYLYPLSDKETVAYLLSELAANYYRKFEQYDAFMLKCAEKSLEYLPQSPVARIQRRSAQTRMGRDARQYLPPAAEHGRRGHETSRHGFPLVAKTIQPMKSTNDKLKKT
ncbi:hypothetical protein [Alistipes sp.]|uniref:hypothetical protein n=1 Tax=Alistipes sp. TaxID=1872444 RepID=UPI003AF09E7A